MQAVSGLPALNWYKEKAMTYWTRPGILFNVEFTVACFFGKTPEDINKASIKREFVLPRHVTWYLYRKVHKLTINEVARRYRKDYNTIRHGIRMVRNLIETDKAFARQLNQLESLIN
jgi:chromosomal replication initiation ATPase DnaA